MIKANELRIGNLVNRQGSELIVNGCDIKWFQEDSYNGLEPIPLTEEILLKCGFKLAIDENIYTLHDTIELTQTDYGNSFYFMGNFIKSDIKHLHQLQNLYFALTGEELILHSK